MAPYYRAPCRVDKKYTPALVPDYSKQGLHAETITLHSGIAGSVPDLEALDFLCFRTIYIPGSP